MLSADDLRLASIKVNEVQNLIKEEEEQNSQRLYILATSWGSVIGAVCIFVVCSCCRCCFCKCCRTEFFWIWDKWIPKYCWSQTQGKCCVNIHNYNGSKVVYTKPAGTSPSFSVKSLPEITPLTEQPRK
jgi:hypothetical protein